MGRTWAAQPPFVPAASVSASSIPVDLIGRIGACDLRLGQASRKLKCAAAACRYWFFEIGGGKKVTDLTSHANYRLDIPDRTDKLISGEFVVPHSNTYFAEGDKDSHGAMIEGYIEAPETGAYRFFTDRSTVSCATMNALLSPLLACSTLKVTRSHLVLCDFLCACSATMHQKCGQQTSRGQAGTCRRSSSSPSAAERW